MSEYESENETEQVQTEQPKRKITDKQLQSRLQNIAKARAARKQMADNKKAVKENLKKQPKIEIYEDEYTDSDSSSESDYPRRSRKKQSRSRKPTAKELKEYDRLDKIENMLMDIQKAQKAVNKKKATKQTIIQLPQTSSSKGSVPASNYLKLFDN